MSAIRPSERSTKLYDIAVIGGGINGAGIAADAAGRGLSVFLCEKDDLASHTSSASSKLIHGGLRYLEHYEFRLVREALAEREVLLAKAPHLVKPLRFVLPHRPHLRPAWMIRVGLFLYDHLGKREKLPASRSVRFDKRSPLKAEIKRGFEYSDCWVDDARLVLLNIQAAHEQGARIATHTRCLSARRTAGVWELDMQQADGRCYSIRTRALVNACGPWVASFLREDLQQRSPYGIRLIQGSHIVVPRLYPGDHAYILQNEDKRIVFAIPYQERYTLIGTTDQEYQGDPGKVAITAAEIDYVLAVTNAHFKHQLSRADVLHSFSGVRPLCDDESDNPAAITRDYTLSLNGEQGEAPLLSVFGGKLTTYRKLAESALAQLAPFFPAMRPAWTSSARLPGGEEMSSPAELRHALVARHPWLDGALAERWARTYGSRTWRLLGDAGGMEALGEHFGAGLYRREVDYLIGHEWATEAEDILWRRTKLGLEFSVEARARLQQYLLARTAKDAPAASIRTPAAYASSLAVR
ncbi:homodimeric glycerol 3-phosphate dehydrogenase (quinone) [Pseudomonas sp. SJZ079]|uniref:glycerol-3-phosphate dehydrogenase n=1 Tax=Pseudomonas sp. SJZ079 TaxID=2572887 RepID=UPI0011993102|nr:glycerol-3-phosphate dehydrogenase [Pseudomonas sp. SJZ079]TWC28037.1 homodimeric glycerol 3-phosphate dehydrogenase (quinone) [Pseudomonas sp. SJZ079]